MTPSEAGGQTFVSDADDEEIEGALNAAQPGEAFRLFTTAMGSPQGDRLDEMTLARLGDALLASGPYGPAARVYDELLRVCPDGELSREAAFRLGTIQSRVFEDYLRARDHLVYAHRAHDNPDRRAQALDELKRIDAHLRSGLLRR